AFSQHEALHTVVSPRVGRRSHPGQTRGVTLSVEAGLGLVLPLPQPSPRRDTEPGAREPADRSGMPSTCCGGCCGGSGRQWYLKPFERSGSEGPTGSPPTPWGFRCPTASVVVVLLDDDLGREEELDRGVRGYPRDAEVGCRPSLRRARAGDRCLAVHAVAMALRLSERG